MAIHIEVVVGSRDRRQDKERQNPRGQSLDSLTTGKQTWDGCIMNRKIMQIKGEIDWRLKS